MAEELADLQVAENEALPVGDIGQVEKPVEVAEEKPKPLSVRESIKKSISEVRADEKGRLHKPDGKFAPKTEAAPKEAAPAEIPQKEAQPKASEAVGPPPGWSAESKAAFATLPEHIRNDLVKREKEVSDGFKKYSDDSKRYQEIEQVLAPLRPTFQQLGVKSDAEAIKSLLGWEASFRNPATRMQAFQNLARQYGVNLNSPQSQVPEVPEQLRPVLDQFGQISQTVNNLQSELQRSREEKVSETLAAFSKDKPHYEKVRIKMGQLIQAGLASPTDLNEAYQQACQLDPEIRATLIKEQFDKQIADQKQTATQHSQVARKAAISPSTRSPVGPVVNGKAQGKQSPRESIMAAIRELREERA